MEELAELSPPLDFSKRLLEEALVIKAKERVKMQTGGWMEWRSIFERGFFSEFPPERKSARIQHRPARVPRGGCNLSKRAPLAADGDALHKLQVVGCFLRGFSLPLLN